MAFGPLVSGTWLAEHAGDPDLRIIDLRWYLDGRSGREEYEKGHIPGSVFVDLDTKITGHDGPGRHPLPAPGQFQEAMRRAGVNARSRVVAYDSASAYSAGRLWWLLRWFGHPQVAVLDGGLKAWPGGLESGSGQAPAAGDFAAAEPDHSAVVDARAIQRLSAGSVLIDARAPERYRGETEPIDPRAGHIPGALSVPWQTNIDNDGRFKPPDRLRQQFAALGIHRGEQVVSYCGSGITAVHNLLALEVAGLDGGRLYEGSWSDWSGRPELPAATGPDP